MEKKTAKQIKDLWLGDNIESAMEEYAQQQIPTKELLNTIEIAYRKGVLNGANGNTDIAKPFLILSQAAAYEIYMGSRLVPDIKSTPSPVEGEKEERIGLLEIELSNTKILLEACESALSQRDARIKALEERLEAADDIIKRYT